jgi:AcrR family transcriptional regulator
MGILFRGNPEKTDLRIQKTKETLRETFISLVEETGFERSSVSEVCKRAKVNRGTFYLHYADKYAILEECLLDLVSIPEAELKARETLPQLEKMTAYIEFVARKCLKRNSFLLGILENGHYPAYYAIVSQYLSAGVEQLIDIIISELSLSRPGWPSYCKVFLSSAFLGSLLDWAKSGKEEDLEPFCALMIRYAISVLKTE